MLRRAWKPVGAATVLVGAPAALYWAYNRTATQETFNVALRVRGPDGKPTMSTRALPLLSAADVDAHITAQTHATRTRRPDGVVWNHTTARVAANDPIEDAHASAIVSRADTVHGAPGDLLFYAVMDGHGGVHTSRLLSKILLPAVALELRGLVDDPATQVPRGGVLDRLKSVLWPPTAVTSEFDADPKYVSLAIQAAFANLDQELVNAPLRLLATNVDPKHRDGKTLPDLSQHPMALPTMLPAMSGSCALMALFDTAHQNLYVANTGDCRAVAGYWNEAADGTGSWRVEVLTEDQTGRNPKELLRMQSEHPLEEAPYVIQRGRVLGGLEPTRAFGDARYKWPREIQDLLNIAFMEGNKQPMRAAPSALKTPPYVTARPVVTHRKLDFLPLPSSTSSEPPTPSSSASSVPGPKSTLRFLILATDGLWDKLSSSDAVALVAGHQAGLHGAVPASALAARVHTTQGARAVEGKGEDKRREKEKQEKTWAFVDENVSAHLIRNAFGGADEGALRKLLSIPPPVARNFRDDVTVTVVWWEDGRAEDAKEAAGKVQAKL